MKNLIDQTPEQRSELSELAEQVAAKKAQEQENFEKAKAAAEEFGKQIPIARTLLINGILGDARSAQIRVQEAERQLSFARQMKRAIDDGQEPEDESGKKIEVSDEDLNKWEAEYAIALEQLRSLSEMHKNFSV